MKNNLSELGYSFLWIDISEPTDEELTKVADELNLPQPALIDCLQPEHLPKFEKLEKTYFLILRYFDSKCNLNNDTYQQISHKLIIFYNNNSITTIKRNQAHWFDDTVEYFAQNKTILQTSDMVCKLVKKTLETFESHLNDLNKNIDYYESRIFLRNKTPDLLKNLYYIKRRLFMMKRLFMLTKYVIDNMGFEGSKGSHFEDLKDYYLKLETIAEEAYDSIISLLNVYISLSSQRTNEVMRLLTVFSAFFLPLTFIVGIYGMNFEYMPELTYKAGYPATILFMAVITLIIYIWFKRKGLL
ncbi:MAG: CorA family divalent cation transporter [Bacteroidia bacterium]